MRSMKRKVAPFMKNMLAAVLAGVALIAGAAEERAEDDVGLAKELLAIPSVSRDVAANDRAVEWMKAYLERHGVWCAVERYAKDGRKILYAATKPGLRTPDFTLVTHLDVVDAKPAQFVPRLENGRLYARGACDTKVNALCGAKALVALNGKASVGCVFASDEEIGGNTTKQMVEMGYGEPRRAVVVLDAGGRNQNIGYACKGNAYYRVTARGRSGHSSRPERCDNPIYRLAEAALKIRDAYPHQKPGEYGNVASVTIVGGGDSQNRIPETAEMTVNGRFVTGGLEGQRQVVERVTGLKTELIRGTNAAVSRADDPELLRMQRLMKSFYPDRPCALVKGVAANDSRYFPQFGKAMMCIGMDLDGGHSDDEWCTVADIPHFTRLLTDYLRGL